MFRPRVTCLLITALALAACRGSNVLSPAALAAAGTYKLKSLTGYGIPTTGNSGSIVLRADGTATYQLTYAPAGTPPRSDQYMATGRFTVRGDSIAFVLGAKPGDPTSGWRTAGFRQGTTLTLHYPGPADGDVAAVYERE